MATKARRWISLGAIVVTLQLAGIDKCHCQGLSEKDSDPWRLSPPILKASTVYRESSVLFQADEKAPIVARLGFPAGTILAVEAANRACQYAEGADFQLGADGKSLIIRNPKSVGVLRPADLFPPAGAANAYQSRVGNPKQWMLYGPGRWFHDRQIEITYRRADAIVPTLTQKPVELPRTIARLRARQPLTIGVSGDSISTGLDSSLTGAAPPKMPGYPTLFAHYLEANYRSSVKLVNRSISGWSIANGVTDLNPLLANKPDLLIVAYGMNDVGRRDPNWFGDQVMTFVKHVRSVDPTIEMILVAPMLGHVEWIHTPREMFVKYREELRKHVGPGIALADVTEVWATLLKNKIDLDLTGNGLNHPNDFGHRLYAQTLVDLLPSVTTLR